MLKKISNLPDQNSSALRGFSTENHSECEKYPSQEVFREDRGEIQGTSANTAQLSLRNTAIGHACNRSAFTEGLGLSYEILF